MGHSELYLRDDGLLSGALPIPVGCRGPFRAHSNRNIARCVQRDGIGHERRLRAAQQIMLILFKFTFKLQVKGEYFSGV